MKSSNEAGGRQAPRSGWASAKKRQRLLGCALLLASLHWPPWGFSLSLYDVIKMSQAGYPDEETVKAIQVTGARFVLDRDSLLRLKEAGVSEPVIQALLKASHAAASAQLSSTRAFDATTPPALEQSAGAFAASPFEEKGAGHSGGGHSASMATDLTVS